MSDGPADAAASPRSPREGRVLVLVDDPRRLVERLAPPYEVVTDDDALDADVDLCLVDEPSLRRHADDLNARRATAAPVFLPVLLVRSDERSTRTPDVGCVDDVLAPTVDRAVLRTRVAGLLERRRLSQALARESTRNVAQRETLFEATPDPTVVLDAGDRVRLVNDAFEDLTGISWPDVRGRPLASVVAFPDDAIEELTTDVRDGSTNDRSPYSIAYTATDGDTRHAEITTATIPGDDGTAIVAVFHDVTDYRRRSQELERQNDRLDEFAGMLAHELRNPLGIAQGYLRVARKDGTPTAYDEVSDALDRMERMVDEMLDLARRPDAAGDPERLAFHDVVEDAWSRTAPPDATLDLRGTDADVSTDVDRLRQVFRNLFRNAVEHAGDDVVVSVERTSDGVVVADDGPGIPADERDVVFESGYTTDDGTGLGLAIVDQIAEAHGWDIDLGAGEHGGARFEISGMSFE